MSTEAVTSLDLYRCFKSVGLSGSSRVIVHASLKSFGFVEGGARTVVQVLLDTCQLVLMPAFTEDQTFVWPAIGDTPLNSYPPPDSRTREASPFRMDMPIDSSIGKIPESMRRDFNALRSQHPALSFVGAGTRKAPGRIV
jgi:aminoglycoside 3-N-acetyltransferase